MTSDELYDLLSSTLQEFVGAPNTSHTRQKLYEKISVSLNLSLFEVENCVRRQGNDIDIEGEKLLQLIKEKNIATN